MACRQIELNVLFIRNSQEGIRSFGTGNNYSQFGNQVLFSSLVTGFYMIVTTMYVVVRVALSNIRSDILNLLLKPQYFLS